MDILKIFGGWAACIAGGVLIGHLIGGEWWAVGGFAGFALPIAWAFWSAMCDANS